jgi:H+/Cl- antiporter ClcA
VTCGLPAERATLGDFTATVRIVPIALLAAAIGALGAVVAFGLLKLIGLFTNLFFFRRWSAALVSPAGHRLGWWVLVVPVIGGLIVGLMARFGSERIRGHGIPEALEAILLRGSRVEPRVALLKPVSAAISIGSGGPFGAEGPIIMTGGAFGSMVAQLVRLTSAERKTLLVAGAAAGMAATFAAPLAAVILAVELLLFELKPRSVIPVALASATAMLARSLVLGPGPLFHVPPHTATIGVKALAGCGAMGILTGCLSAAMTRSVYAAEDAFHRLPCHWMWWPAMGGIAIGVGGLVHPRALGVGYETIEDLLNGALPYREVVVLMAVKWVIWAVSLGSGTSGGVLAPLLMLGSALGGLAGTFLPGAGAAFWPVVGMGSVLGGMMRSPLTAVVFSVELTGDYGMLLPVLVAAVVSHGFTVLTMPRSILTEKVARRGYHMTREYAIDPLEVLFVREVMHTKVVGLPAAATPESVERLLESRTGRVEPLYAVLGEEDDFQGVITRRNLLEWIGAGREGGVRTVGQIADGSPVVASPDETLRTAVHRMAETGRTRLPVVSSNDPRRLMGMIALSHTLKARQRHLEEERRRERVRPVEVLLPEALRRRWSRASGRGRRP